LTQDTGGDDLSHTAGAVTGYCTSALNSFLFERALIRISIFKVTPTAAMGKLRGVSAGLGMQVTVLTLDYSEWSFASS
jgi:hypothetical protein